MNLKNDFRRWFRKSSIKSLIKAMLPNSLIRRMAYIYNSQWKRKKENSTPRMELGFETHIVEHCNLNCASCCHFSPLANEEYLDIESFEKDLARIYELTKRLRYIRLLGGEPLLHPRIVDFFEITRKYFSDTPVQVTTNGILLLKMSDDFWESCKKYDIEINITDYPINIHFDKIKHWRDKGVKLNYKPSTINATNSFHFSPIDINGGQIMQYNFSNCEYPNNFCITLRAGRLYTCCLAAHARFFNEYFHQRLDTSKANSISIYEAGSIKEILNFLCKPIPFCKHCSVKNFVYGIKWERSKRIMSEWTFNQ